MPLPPFTESGDPPLGVHQAPGHTLTEALSRFGAGSPPRRMMALRLARIYSLAWATGQLARFAVFGSFVTDKLEPNDVDVFLLMEDTFDVARLAGEPRLLFEHAAAQAHFGGSVFLAARSGDPWWRADDHRILASQTNGSYRDIVEIIPESPWLLMTKNFMKR